MLNISCLQALSYSQSDAVRHKYSVYIIQCAKHLLLLKYMIRKTLSRNGFKIMLQATDRGRQEDLQQYIFSS